MVGLLCRAAKMLDMKVGPEPVGEAKRGAAQSCGCPCAQPLPLVSQWVSSFLGSCLFDLPTAKESIYQPNKNLNSFISGNCDHGLHLPVRQKVRPSHRRWKSQEEMCKPLFTRRPKWGSSALIGGGIWVCVPYWCNGDFTAPGTCQNSPLHSDCHLGPGWRQTPPYYGYHGNHHCLALQA